MTNVTNYTDIELLNRAINTPGFRGFPSGYWLLGVQSKEDEFNVFDDKIYLFRNNQFIDVCFGTTNAGANSLLDFAKFKLKGALVWKTDEWYYDIWTPLSWDMNTPYLHKGKMPALRQCGNIKIYRDSNKNKKVEEIGNYEVGNNYGANFHTNTYEKPSKVSKALKWLIGGWSWGCVVTNDPYKYYNIFLPKLRTQKYVSYCLIKEF